MIDLEDLFYLAALQKVKVVYKNLRSIHPKFLGKANAATRTVTLDWSLRYNHRQLKCVLAEELGHIFYPPRPGHIRYHSKGFYQGENCGLIKHIVDQDEIRALDWSTGVLMPDVEFNRIMENGGYSVGEIAEMFDVEPWCVDHKIGYYRRKQKSLGRRVKWRDLIRRI